MDDKPLRLVRGVRAMRAILISTALLAALPAAAHPIVVCGSETALEIQRQAGNKFRASDCWRDESTRYKLDKAYRDDDGIDVVSLIDPKANAGHGGEVVTTARAWGRGRR